MDISARLRSSRRGGASYATDLTIATCAASAGAHAALVPQHLGDEPALGLAFIAAAAALVAVAIALIAHPDDRRLHHAAALVLGALIGGYALSVTTELPWRTEAEPVDPVALATKCVEAVGLVSAVWMGSTTGGRSSLTTEEDR